jgi:hypothetical protein
MISCCIRCGWYHHVWCILYTNDVINGIMLCIVPGSVSVACSPILWKGWVVSQWPWHLQELFWWGCEYWYLCGQICIINSVLGWCTFELCYWPARSFSRVPRRDASLLCHWVLLHGWLTLMWCSVKMSSLLGRYDFPRCYTPIPLFVW